jgi:hypothetical protein
MNELMKFIKILPIAMVQTLLLIGVGALLVVVILKISNVVMELQDKYNIKQINKENKQ